MDDYLRQVQMLRREVRYHKIALVCVSGLVVLGLFLGQAKSTTPVNHNVVTANAFILVDGKGKKIGRWEPLKNGDGSHFVMTNDDPMEYYKVWINNDGVTQFIMSPNGVAQVGVAGGGPFMSISGGTPGEGNQSSIMMSTTSDGNNRNSRIRVSNKGTLYDFP